VNDLNEKRRFDHVSGFAGTAVELRLGPTAAKSFAEVRDDIRLKGFLRKAVRRDAAPQYLIDTIREAVRRG
jgi:hypothetical protein